MKKELKQIITGLLAVIFFTGVVFFCLYRYMDIQAEKDMHEIARVFLENSANQESQRYEAIMLIRFEQMDSMKIRLMELGEDADAETIESTLAYAAKFQDLSNCSLISDSGMVETIYGDEIESFGDKDFLLDSLRSGQRQIITDGRSESEQIMIMASPLTVPMDNCETSIGLIWCKPMSFFTELMNLDSPDALVNFHIIRHDTSYVIEEDSNKETSYDERVKNLAFYKNESKEEYLDGLHQAIAKGTTFTRHIRYIEEDGIDMRRSVHAMPLQNSNWYLLSIMPYGILDETIAGMGNVRMNGMFAGVSILVIIILLVFLQYMRMMQNKIVELEISKASAVSAMEEAEAARRDAVAANKAKSEFLSNMSHDIRTPMNAIVGMTAIATDHIDEKERVQDCLKKITLSGQQLLGLINDILDMSKIESGKMTLNVEALSLRHTMETMSDIVRPQIQTNGQHFEIFISNIVCEEVYCDSVRLNQVLLNFLSNAMKFTPQGGEIQMDLWQEESPKGENYVRTHISVKDSGMGMSEEFRKKLFTAFEREDNRRVQKTQGTGLGLTITRYIIDAMGGTIDVKSEVGVGSTFAVTVDFEKVEVAVEEMKLPDWRVLVVDNSEELCRTTKLTLEELGVRAETCLSGQEAVEKVLEAERSGDSYFAVLIDYKMSGMSGVETAKVIHEKIDEHVPLSLISAYDWADIEEEAKAAGISGFISKPLFKSTLYHELRKFQNEEGAEQEELQDSHSADLGGIRILLAEDNDINAEIATMILEETGCIVEHAPDGKIAVEMFEKSEEGYYDIVLMDLRMPNMNGIEATETIRAMKRSDAGKIPIIAITADAFAEDAQKCMAAGMNAHLTKPIDVEQLTATLVKFTGR